MRRRWLPIAVAALMTSGCTSQDTLPPSADSTVATAVPVSAPRASMPATYPTVPLSSADPVATSLTPGPGSPIVVELSLIHI